MTMPKYIAFVDIDYYPYVVTELGESQEKWREPYGIEADSAEEAAKLVAAEEWDGHWYDIYVAPADAVHVLRWTPKGDE